MTYRQSGHSRSDPATYRPPGELESWLARDPILIAGQRLRDLGVEESELSEVRDLAAATVREAAERALSWPEPAAESRFDDVWAAR
jgi:pyruvate dehydrogenase E1 component alpha subunit